VCKVNIGDHMIPPLFKSCRALLSMADLLWRAYRQLVFLHTSPLGLRMLCFISIDVRIHQNVFRITNHLLFKFCSPSSPSLFLTPFPLLCHYPWFQQRHQVRPPRIKIRWSPHALELDGFAMESEGGTSWLVAFHMYCPYASHRHWYIPPKSSKSYFKKIMLPGPRLPAMKRKPWRSNLVDFLNNSCWLMLRIPQR